MVDPGGRFVFVKGTIYGHRFTFAAVYAPNSIQLTLLDSVLESLSTFRDGQLILVGILTFALIHS